MARRKAFRSSIVHCIADPREVGTEACYEYFDDGLLVVEDGIVRELGPAAILLKKFRDADVTEFRDSLVTSGFIDTHIHFPQVDIIGAYGERLLQWLENYVFPAEREYADPEYARSRAQFFLAELLRNGTTTALVFGTVHRQSIDAFFSEAEKLDLRMLAGKVMMDRNAPGYLCDTPESSYADSRDLIERWHGKGRLHYAITPRFAPTSSAEQLAMAGRLRREYPGVYFHTHISESKQEVEWVHSLFPERKGYLDVYDHYGLVGSRCVFAHGIYLRDDECRRLGEVGSAVAFCPTSNLFLGSGLLDLYRLEQYGIRVGLGSDVGAGTSFSQLQSLNEAYKVLQLQGSKLDPLNALYLATLGGARALYLDGHIGNLQPGKEADFVVLDYRATPLIWHRIQQESNLRDRLFLLMMLGDDRVVKATYVAGICRHHQ